MTGKGDGLCEKGVSQCSERERERRKFRNESVVEELRRMEPWWRILTLNGI